MRKGQRNYLIKRGQILNSYNNKLALRMCKQKDVTSRYLRAGGFPAPENASFYKTQVTRAWSWAKYILPVVLKPVDGALGDMVYVNISNKKEFIKYFKQIAKKYDRVLVEKFCIGNDHRVLVVEGKVVGIINRVPASIVGNGKLSVKQLIDNKNFKRKKHPVLKQIIIDEDVKRNLKKYKYTLKSKPKNNEVIYLKDNANISDGADSFEVSDKVSKEIKVMVENAIKSMPGLHVCGLDVQINGEEAHIIEINGNPMVHVHHYTTCGNGVKVAEEVIKAMFSSKLNHGVM